VRRGGLYPRARTELPRHLAWMVQQCGATPPPM